MGRRSREGFFDKKFHTKNSSKYALPNSISNLKKLTTLLLCDCMALENVPSLSKLRALKKLNLIATSRAEEMKTVNKLEVLEVCFNDMHDLSMYASQRKRPNDYNILVGLNLMEIGFDSVEISKSVTINCFNVKIKNSIILPSDIQGLRLRGCECNGSSFSDIIGSEGVTDLKKCTVDSCNGLESIFSSRCASLQTIEILLLEYLWNLKLIVGESMPPEPGTFSNLQSIYIIGCAKLKNLFSAKWVHSICVQDFNVWSISGSLCAVSDASEILSPQEFQAQQMSLDGHFGSFVFPNQACSSSDIGDA
ncbi:hypothetical protein QUC31_002100 [Theobroma cacao]